LNENKKGIYILDGTEFKIKDLTNDESKEVQTLFTIIGSNIEVANKKSQELFSLILTPVNEFAKVKIVTKRLHKKLLTQLYKRMGKNIKVTYPGDWDEKVTVEIVKDFFTGRIEKNSDFASYFLTLIKGQNKLPTNTKA
jgi:predicted site-specific integrase-resolvase